MPPVGYVRQLLSHLSSIGYGTLATLMGRYYAMDRDKRFERTKVAFEALVKGTAESVPTEQLIAVRWYMTLICTTNVLLL